MATNHVSTNNIAW
jgi:hypothetical protein